METFQTSVEAYQKRINEELDSFLESKRPAALYGMMRYFLGFTDLELQKLAAPVGKRLRSVLCLLLGEAYGAKSNVLPLALSLELFHNFTLIHDDIVDRDEMRRGRPTVWKVWGEHHALNAGDAQFLLAIEQMNVFVQSHPEIGWRVEEILRPRYGEVIEGQYLDFRLAELSLTDPQVNEEFFFTMTDKKSSVLVGAAAQSGGIAGRAPAADEKMLWEYGFLLGRVLQLQNDFVSIWESRSDTGKSRYGDIREKKKTLPIIHTYRRLSPREAGRMKELYDLPAPLSEAAVFEIAEFLEKADARGYLLRELEKNAQESLQALESLSVSDSVKTMLRALNDSITANVL